MLFADLDQLPTPIADPSLPARLLAEITRSGRKVIALDDDPTGSQTVHDTPVLTSWSTDAFVAELQDPGALLFVLTNSRSLPSAAAAAINTKVA